MTRARNRHRGFTLAELLVALAIAGLLLAGISGIVQNVGATGRVVGERNQLLREARFAMQRMVRSTEQTSTLVLPMPDKPDTDWRENVREQTVPASPPEGSSTLATAVLAVALSASVDLDGDGFADADNDRDGRIDEDYPADLTNDDAPGIYLVDDGGDGSADEGSGNLEDDDEQQNASDEDPFNGIDDDGDGVTDEDPGADVNADGQSGIASVDDDADGQIDESSAADDDEDGSADEDWLDAVVFSLQGGTLTERHPVPWDESGEGGITGRDYLTSVIAENVTRFRVERVDGSVHPAGLVNIQLELSGPTGSVVSLSADVRVGGAL